ncbi:hypothetical protein DFAR_630004 [Desulfarculales bacterium]
MHGGLDEGNNFKLTIVFLLLPVLSLLGSGPGRFDAIAVPDQHQDHPVAWLGLDRYLAYSEILRGRNRRRLRGPVHGGRLPFLHRQP